MKRKLCFIYGTRPEIIKLSPIIKLCGEKKIPFFCVHTGQHYSYNMDKIFFRELALPSPKYKLYIKSRTAYMQGEHTGRMLIDIEKILLKQLPYCVIVQGDTNTVLAGALAAKKISTTENFTSLCIKLAHVEAGLRSFDWRMPEEYNRIIADRLSDFLFAPTIKEKELLLREQIPKSQIYVTGNTIVDTIKQSISIAKQKSHILEKLRLRKSSYILLTLHRQESVDEKKVFSNILKGLAKTCRRLKLPIIFPMHPRTTKILNILRLKTPQGVRVIAPIGFLDFIWLEANAALVMTDSGGVQEETCILKVPCVTLRLSTERPETVSVGSNVVAGIQPEGIMHAAVKMFKIERKWKNPFGDGRTAERILNILLD